jgi:stage V sporulation protein B
MSKHSFIKGAAIFAMAGIFAKFLGIFFKVPLNYLTGNEGLGIYNYPYPLYTTMLAVSTSGLPVAISKMVSERIALNRRDEAHRVFRISVVILAVIGALSSLALLLGGNLIIKYGGWDPDTIYSIYALAPAPFFVSIMSCFRGYFQGMHNMVPTSLSLIVESFMRVVAGIGLTYLLIQNNSSLGMAVGGASFGATAGAVGGSIVLMSIYMIRRKRYSVNTSVPKGPSQGSISIIYRLISIAIPISIGAAIASFMAVIDSVLIPSRLLSSGNYTMEQITEVWGLYSKGLTMINVPVTFSIAISAALVPSISSAMAQKNYKEIREKTQSAVNIALIIGIPSALGLSVLAKGIIPMIFRKYPEGGYILEILSYSIIFIIITQTFTAVLQGIGKVTIPVRNLFIGGIVKVVANYILVSIPSLNIKGAAIGSILGYGVAALLNYRDVKKHTKIEVSLYKSALKPVICGVIMALATIFCYDGVYDITSSNTISTLCAITIGIIIYSMLLLVLGVVNPRDLDSIPGGSKINRYMPKNTIKK